MVIWERNGAAGDDLYGWVGWRGWMGSPDDEWVYGMGLSIVVERLKLVRYSTLYIVGEHRSIHHTC